VGDGDDLAAQAEGEQRLCGRGHEGDDAHGMSMSRRATVVAAATLAEVA
jgi:hypothetical protein